MFYRALNIYKELNLYENTLQSIFILISIRFSLIFLESFLRINPELGYNYDYFRFKSDKLTRLATFAFLQPSALLGYEHIPDLGTYG